MQRFMVLVLLLVTGSPHAQAQTSGATDNELYAAYCKGAMNGLNQGSAQVQQMSRRFSSYLFATGVMTDPQRRDAMLGIGAALARGRTDQQQCSATLLACNDAVNNAMRKPSIPAQKGDRGLQLFACTERNPSCPRVARCMGPDALPF